MAEFSRRTCVEPHIPRGRIQAGFRVIAGNTQFLNTTTIFYMDAQQLHIHEKGSFRFSVPMGARSGSSSPFTFFVSVHCMDGKYSTADVFLNFQIVDVEHFSNLELAVGSRSQAISGER